jgi:membrane-bound lytic murein transglycosylase D
VRFNFILALSLLFLAGCATTGSNSQQQDSAIPDSQAITEIQPGSAATVDEHLYIPEPTPESEAESQDILISVSVWERVIQRFELEDCRNHEISLQWADWYAARPEYMARIFNRAQPWIYYIAEELERRDMPGELALLPIVESAYDPFAYSRGRALGTWQFISATGRRYGLKQNWWYDGRRDVYSSTTAALEYLSVMQQMFDGDWLLALAGYNSGEGRVERAVKRNQRAGKPADFWNIKLPRETRGYVPKLLGLACIFQYPEDYNFRIARTPNKPVIAAVDVGYQADLVLVSQMAGVPIDQIFTLNPGYNRWATSPDGPFHVVLPVANAERLRAALETVQPNSLMKWDEVSVERGDTLSTLADRHHVPVEVIRSANGINGDLIRVGQRLRLPRDDQLLVDPLYAQAATELAKLQSGLLAADRMTHRVRPGESLSVIARRYRVSVQDLQRWNNISDPRTLRAGRNIVVFASPAPGAPTSGGSFKYTVQTGDSLWSIARKHKVKLKDLMSWNGLSASTVLQPGQNITINP